MKKQYVPKTMKTWVINTIFLCEIVVFTVLNIVSSGTIALLIIPFMAAFGGWQMGVLIERNDWVAGHWRRK